MRGSLLLYFIVNIVISAVSSESQNESCQKNIGQTVIRGVCKSMTICQPALKLLPHRRDILQKIICEFEGTIPIVCCAQDYTQTARHTTTPYVRPVKTTTEYTPMEPDYDDQETPKSCKPLRDFTAAPGDRISWKKCLQYEEELIYPCEKSHALAGGAMVRGKHCKHKANKLIYGGEDAGEGEFPHMVLLSFSEKAEDFFGECGGSLLSDWFILTAGHCTHKGRVGPVKYAATGVLKRTDLSRSKIYGIADIIKPRNYDGLTHYHDIALLKTASKMKLNMFAVPACLDLGQDSDAEAIATGWGANASRIQTTDILQKVTLQKFSNEECHRKMEQLQLRKLPNGIDESTQVCYGDKRESKDACNGDSGGPLQVAVGRLQCMYNIIGITSFGKDCGVIGRPGVFVRVAPYLDWIERTVWPNEH